MSPKKRSTSSSPSSSPSSTKHSAPSSPAALPPDDHDPPPPCTTRPRDPPVPSSPSTIRTTDLNARYGRNALAAYALAPSLFPPATVLSHDAAFVALRDAFPKAAVHLLLLPRAPARRRLHPLAALSADPAFLAAVRAAADVLATAAAAELRRLFGHRSAADAARNAVLDDSVAAPRDRDRDRDGDDGDGADPPLPPGRDWRRDVKVGVHVRPSMNDLHVHVLSVEHAAPALRHRAHYNSFATPFFVPLDAFPLSREQRRRRAGTDGEDLLRAPLVCWRCGEGFGDGFARFKRHLEGEFERWVVL